MTVGRLALQFSLDKPTSTTRLRIKAQEPPLRVVRAFAAPDGAALVHLHNLSGGVLGGDRLATEVSVGAGARVQLTTTGATRLYRRRAGAGAAQQTTRLVVGAGALLEYLPDLVIPYAGAYYRQQTVVELEPGAGLFYWEVVAPGRTARGEWVAYEQVRIDLDLLVAGRPLLLERLALQPAQQPLNSPLRLGPFFYFASFYIAKVGVAANIWADLETSLADLAESHSVRGEILLGVSALSAHGLFVRAAARSAEPINAALIDFWQHAKQKLYGAEAIFPRKIN